MLKNKLSKVNNRLFQFILWQLGYYKDSLSLNSVPAHFNYPNPEEHIDQAKPWAMWINHSTFLLHIEGIYLLTDPIWNTRCSPVQGIGPKRKIQPGMQLKDLSQVDIVLISHDHYDHLDYFSVSQLHRKFPNITWIVPRGVKKWFIKHFPSMRLSQIIELGWGDFSHVHFNSLQVEIISVPARHFSGRGLFGQNKTLWMGVVINFYKNQKKWKTLYFAGDTGYHADYFKRIGQLYGPMDLSLIPIGVYSPREFMKPVHVNPQESVVIHQEVNSQLSIGCHFGTFKLSNEDLRQPPYDLYQILQQQGLNVEQFRVPKPGQSINW